MKLVILLAFLTVQAVNISWSNQSLEKKEGRKADTNEHHRATIIRALETGLRGKDEVFNRHFTKVLLKNITRPMSSSDLALWIGALIALKEDPRNQDGINLVAELTRRVNAEALPRPFLLLTLCDAQVVSRKQLQKLSTYSSGRFPNSTRTARGLETEALVLKTLACAQTLPTAEEQNLDEFVPEMLDVAKRLRLALADGYFGNIYTTSLICQALTAFSMVIDPAFEWKEKEALEYLRKESSTPGGLTKAYYIAMALNARRVPFLKDLHQQSYDTHLSVRKHIYVRLSLRNEENKDVDFAMTLRVPGGWNLFQIMLNAAGFSHRFRFSYTENKNKEPVIFEIDSTASDPEKGLYWILCSSTPERTNGFFATPSLFIPHDGENIILWYRSSDCPTL